MNNGRSSTATKGCTSTNNNEKSSTTHDNDKSLLNNDNCTNSSNSSPWQERIPTEMNACSIEVLNCYNNNEHKTSLSLSDGSTEKEETIPLIIGCYELIDEVNQIVKGQIRVYNIVAPQEYDTNDPSTLLQPPSVGESPIQIIDTDGGIFDGTFYEYSQIQFPSGFLTKPGNSSGIVDDDANEKVWIYAAACSSGNILLYALRSFSKKKNDGITVEHPLLEKPSNSFCLSYIASTSTLDDVDDDDSNRSSSCLSMDWKRPQQSTNTVSSTIPFLNNDDSVCSILSSYSNGYLAIHTIQFCPQEEDESQYPIISEQIKWNAHYYHFNNTPAEVWSCCWINNNEHIHVVSGGDDCKLKGWYLSYDVDSSMITPILQFQMEHDAGVTCLSAHPTISTLVLSGSYNEEIRLWDFSSDAVTLTKKKQPRLVSSQPSCSGGIWRLKWHPFQKDVCLVAAMHGGAHIIRIIPGLETSQEQSADRNDLSLSSMDIVSSFTCHESMVYGAGWIVIGGSEKMSESYAATCSFYDQVAFLWKE